MTQNNDCFTFILRMGNPNSRKFLAIKDDLSNVGAGRTSLLFDSMSKDEFEGARMEDWTASPQPNGMWISGDSGIPKSMTMVVQSFLKQQDEVEDVSFFMSSVETDASKFVLITQDAFTVVDLGDKVKELKEIARQEIETSADTDFSW